MIPVQKTASVTNLTQLQYSVTSGLSAGKSYTFEITATNSAKKTSTPISQTFTTESAATAPG